MRRLVQTLTLAILLVLPLVGALLNGCSGNSAQIGSGPSPGPSGPVGMNHELAGIDADATLFVYSGFDEDGDLVFGSASLPRAARNVLASVPFEVRTVTVEYRTADERLVSWASTPVQVSTEAVTEATPTPAAGSTVLQLQNTTSATARMALTAYNKPSNLDNLKVYSLTDSGPVTMTPMPDGSNWRYVDMAGGEQYEVYSIEPNGSNVVDNQLNSFLVAFGDPASFATQPYCPGIFNLYPNGINYFECTLNVTTGETLDISLNQGANSYLGVQCSPSPPIPGWTTNNGLQAVTSFRNSYLSVANSYDDNCCLVGVFAYGLSNCTAGPPSCPSPGTANPGPFCSNDAIHCQVMRQPGQQGGLVLVQFHGLMNPTVTPSPACSP